MERGLQTYKYIHSSHLLPLPLNLNSESFMQMNNYQTHREGAIEAFLF